MLAIWHLNEALAGIRRAVAKAGIGDDADMLISRLLAPHPALRPRSAAAIGNTLAQASEARRRR